MASDFLGVQVNFPGVPANVLGVRKWGVLAFMPSATRNLFEKRFLDFQKLFFKMVIYHSYHIHQR